MKRLCITLTACLFLLVGCSEKETDYLPINTTTQPPPGSSGQQVEALTPQHGELRERQTGDVIEISEKLFIAQTNDIYLNLDDYLGKTVRYEGIYQNELWQNGDESEEIHYVIRYGPGCCGNDDNAGFEIVWDGEYPQYDDWVEVSGVVTKVDVGQSYYVQLQLDSLTIKAERGQEYVAQ